MATKHVEKMRIRVIFPGDRQLAFQRVYNSQVILNLHNKCHMKKMLLRQIVKKKSSKQCINWVKHK